MNDDAFEFVVNTHYQGLYRFALSLARHESTACDLTQETFRRFAAKGHQLRDQSKVKTWLFTTLYRLFLRDVQEERRLEPLELTDDENTAASLPECEASVDGETARNALLELDEPFRAPLSLFYLEEHSYQEIAHILNVPMGTVMSRIARGRELLRRRLRGRTPKSGNPLLSISL